MKNSELHIPISEKITVKGFLAIPENANGLVIFSHGSGSSRFSSRNRYVADVLNQNNIATLLPDLLSEEEDKIYENRFDISLLTARLLTVTAFASQLEELKDLSLGYFGASTGAASALKAAAYLGEKIQCIVSRGGRPDLANDILHKVTAPTLLIVGSLDEPVITLNRNAFSKLNCIRDIQIINGASHLFEEPGRLEEVAGMALDWFNKYLLYVPANNK